VYTDWREQRRLERMARHEARWGKSGERRHGWLWGALLIVLGVALLYENLGIPFLTNWWALFILIPAFWGYVGAWNRYQSNGMFTRGVAGSLTGALLLTLLALVFLFNVELGVYWPLLLVVGGLALLATGLVPE
jgi:hypothetical protein